MIEFAELKTKGVNQLRAGAYVSIATMRNGDADDGNVVLAIGSTPGADEDGEQTNSWLGAQLTPEEAHRLAALLSAAAEP